MQADGLFWGIAALVAAGCAGLVFAPLLRAGARPERRASYDLQVHRDQLREVEADLARGILSADEAAATRIEVSRRLLAAADAEAAEAAGAAAPRRLSRIAAPAMIAGVLAAAFGLYGWLGGAGAPDAPLAPRLAEAAAARAARPSQAEAEAAVARQQSAPPPVAVSANDLALIGKLETALETRPDDLAGHRLLAQTLASIGNWAPARAAQERVVALLADKATARDLVDLAELSILAAGGYVSPEAERALSRALTLDPRDQVGRYYSALTLMQGGRPDLAYRIWSGLLAEGPADAPWAEGARAGAAEAARLAGIAPGRDGRRADAGRRRRGGGAAARPAPGDDRGHGGAALRPARHPGRPARRLGAAHPLARRARAWRRGGGDPRRGAAEARWRPGGAGRDRGGRPRRGTRAVSGRVVEDVAAFAAGLPRGGALMGLDLGTKTIGVAVSDTGRVIASPLETIRRTRFGTDAAALLALVGPRRIAGLVLGLPRNMDGSEGPRAQSTRAFARNLARLTELPITFWDERLSTVAAERALLEADASRKRRAEVIDHVAAGLILQGLLDRLAYLAREAE